MTTIASLGYKKPLYNFLSVQSKTLKAKKLSESIVLKASLKHKISKHGNNVFICLNIFISKELNKHAYIHYSILFLLIIVSTFNLCN